MLDILENCMARGRALYDGHAVAAVAAVDETTARKALKLIKVQYKKLPHVTDVDEAMKPSAPVVQDWIRLEESIRRRRVGQTCTSVVSSVMAT